MRKFSGLAFGLVAMAVAGSAIAGYRAGSTVFINSASRVFVGTVSTTRNSPDATQYLQIQHSANSSSEYVAFAARDASGNFATCYSYAAPIISAAKAVLSDSHLQVNYDTSGVCTSVTVFNSSWSPPKNP
jgi:hypothetical protein